MTGNWQFAVNEMLIMLGWLAGWVVMGLAPRRIPSGYRHTKEKVSIIIPARNEAQRLPSLLESLKPLPADWEVIVADDHSSDDTIAVSRSLGAKVIVTPPLPSGWQGKAWACWHGAQNATGEWLVFLDADLIISPTQIMQLLNHLYKGPSLYQKEAATVQPWHHVRSFPEQFSAWFNVMVWLGTSSLSSPRKGGFGPSLIVAKDAYFLVGGHQSVASCILENHQLTRLLSSQSVKVHNFLGDQNWQFRMHHHQFRSVIRGWGKHFIAGARSAPIARLLLTILWITGFCAELFGLFFHVHDELTTLLLLLGFVFQVALAFRKVGSFRWYTIIISPIMLMFFFAVFLWSLLFRRRAQVWKDRNLSLPRKVMRP